MSEIICTRCGKEINDLKVDICLDINVTRKKSNEIWENIANLDQTSHEILCPECFDFFCNVINILNTPDTSDSPVPNQHFNPEPSYQESFIPEESGTSVFNPLSMESIKPKTDDGFGIIVDDQVDYR